MEQLRLVWPAMEHKARFEEMMEEWEAFGGRINPGAMRRYNKESGQKIAYEDWLDRMDAEREEKQSFYFLMLGERILGATSLRHKSAGINGHIAYGIRPSERRKGYAAKMLAMALPRMKQYGENPVIISCAKENLGSARTIQKNGGILMEEVDDDDELVQIYHIDMSGISKERDGGKIVKAIITDLDRTLLHTDKTISEHTLKILRECHEKGILLMAATARPERAITEYHKLVQFDALTVMNGADVVFPEGEGIGNRQGNEIPRESAEVILQRLCELPDVVLSIECGNEVYASVEIPEWNAKVFTEFPKLPTDGPIYKILVSREGENIGPVVENLLTGDTYCTVANDNLVQIMNKQATKWNGIRLMLEVYGIASEQAVYFGDDNDDIEPLKNCGIGVAVANAIDKVKEAADEVAESNDEDGVAKWIERNLLWFQFMDKGKVIISGRQKNDT